MTLEDRLFEDIRAGKEVEIERALLIVTGCGTEKKIAEYQDKIQRLSDRFDAYKKTNNISNNAISPGNDFDKLINVSKLQLRPHHVERALVSWAFMSDETIMLALRKHKRGYTEECIRNGIEVYGRIKRNEPFVLVPSIDDICNKCHWNTSSECMSEQEHYCAYATEEFGMRFGQTYKPKDILEPVIRRLIDLNSDEEQMYRSEWWEVIPRGVRIKAYLEMHRKLSGDSL